MWVHIYTHPSKNIGEQVAAIKSQVTMKYLNHSLAKRSVGVFKKAIIIHHLEFSFIIKQAKITFLTVNHTKTLLSDLDELS